MKQFIYNGIASGITDFPGIVDPISGSLKLFTIERAFNPNYKIYEKWGILTVEDDEAAIIVKDPRYTAGIVQPFTGFEGKTKVVNPLGFTDEQIHEIETAIAADPTSQALMVEHVMAIAHDKVGTLGATKPAETITEHVTEN